MEDGAHVDTVGRDDSADGGPASTRRNYRANRSQFFLTYSRCPLDKEYLLDALRNIGEVQSYVIAREQHQDGGTHLHAFVRFRDKKNFRDARWADVVDEDGVVYHPNDGGAVRSHKAVLKYVQKDGDFISSGDLDLFDPYTEAILSETVRQGMEIIQKKKPRDFVLYQENIERTLKKLKRTVYKPVTYPLCDYVVDPLEFEGKAILVHGPTDIGKTKFCRAHFENPLVISHIDQLKKYEAGVHDGLIFDDMSFTHWPPEAVIHLLDMEEEREIHCRYANAVMPAGVPRVFTHNYPNPFYNLDTTMPAQRDAIERRLKRYGFEEKMYFVNSNVNSQ